MLKKTLSLLFALLMIMPIASPAAVGEDAAPQKLTNSDGFVYTVNADGSAEIAGYTGQDQKLVIPESVDGHRVISIGKRAFTGARITEVTVAASVREIRDNAFEHCDKLTAVRLPEGVEIIGEGIFWQCQKLKTVNLPDTLKEIGDEVFFDCKALTAVQLSAGHPLLELADGVLFVRAAKRLIWYPNRKSNKSYAIPEGTAAIGRYAFGFVNSLTAVQIPDSVTEIAYSAFTECKKLQEINIPAQVTELDGVFRSCNSLKQIQVSPENPVFYSLDGVLFRKESQQLVLYPAGRSEKKYVIPEGTLEIGTDSFSTASHLVEVEIPGTVRKIGSCAFDRCSKLKTVRISEGVEELGLCAFEWCSALTEIRLPLSLVKMGPNPFVYCRKLSKVIVDEDHPALAVMDGALICKEDMRLVWYPQTGKAKKYAVPQGVRSIDSYAFEECKQLNEIELPEGIETVGYRAFNSCKNIKRIILPATLKEIDNTAFQKEVTNFVMIPATYVVVKGSYAENFCQAYGLKIEYAP